MKAMLQQSCTAATGRNLALVACLMFMGSVLEGSPFARIVSFGDSLADTGNIFRASNGPVWPEYLAGYLNVPLADYAYSGATTGYGGSNPGFAGEVDLFLEDAAVEGVSNRDLFTVVIGGNDFIAYFTAGGPNPIPGSIANTVAGVQRLLEAGARYMVVWTVPDLGITPATAFLSDEERAYIGWLTEQYNAALKAALEDLASGYNCKLVVVDINSAFYDLIANPGDYGLTNVLYPAAYTGMDPDTSLFWDSIHPTTFGHQLLAEFVLDSMLDVLVPGRAIGLEGNVPGWVHP